MTINKRKTNKVIYIIGDDDSNKEKILKFLIGEQRYS
jgi:hypothetical protein